MGLRNKKHSVRYMFCSQILAIMITSFTAIDIITVKEPGLSCRVQSMSSCTGWAMPGTRDSSFPEGQRRAQALTSLVGDSE